MWPTPKSPSTGAEGDEPRVTGDARYLAFGPVCNVSVRQRPYAVLMPYHRHVQSAAPAQSLGSVPFDLVGRGQMSDTIDAGRRVRPRRRRLGARFRRHPLRTTVAIGLAALLVWLAVSLGSALTDQALGNSASARFAEWAREHGASGMVNWAENEWYSHHPPPVGGRPPAGAIRRPRSVPVAATAAAAATPAHLPAPPAITPVVSPAIPGEGQWSPAGRLVGGVPAVYVTTLRPDPIHTSYVVGAAWMDTKLLRATLYSGSQIPGGGPYRTPPPSPRRRPVPWWRRSTPGS